MGRNSTIDIAKGIGIILVVLGHNWMAQDKGLLFRSIYAFHMPLFFLLAGVFLKPWLPMRANIASKTAALLKPYFVVLACVLAAVHLYHAAAHDLDLQLALKQAFRIIYGNAALVGWGQLWFLTHLFLSSLFSLLVIRALKDSPLPAKAAAITGLLALGSHFIDRWWPGADLFGKFKIPPALGLPWSLDLLPVTSAFVLAGYFLKERIKEFRTSPSLLLLSVFIFVGAQIAFHNTIDLALRSYEKPIISSLQALAGIYMTLCLSEALSRQRRMERLLGAIGRSSLFIFIFHAYIQDTIFTALRAAWGHPYASAILSLAAGIFFPMVLLEASRRSRWLSRALLPVPAPH